MWGLGVGCVGWFPTRLIRRRAAGEPLRRLAGHDETAKRVVAAGGGTQTVTDATDPRTLKVAFPPESDGPSVHFSGAVLAPNSIPPRRGRVWR